MEKSPDNENCKEEIIILFLQVHDLKLFSLYEQLLSLKAA